MGISAVPGSGKTWTLSLLAANILSEAILEEDQEILIVTLVNSAVDNFYKRIKDFLSSGQIFPIGFRVRTLHGLAHDIVRERPDLLKLDNNFQIIDEHDAESIRKEVSQIWLHNHPHALDEFLKTDLYESQVSYVYNVGILELINDIALSFIRSAKDQRLTPDRFRQKLHEIPVPLSLVEMGLELYTEYQRALAYRGGVDFDDLIRLALDALEWDRDLLHRLQHRWPYILEDEAQDSSSLQESILRKLTGPAGNWVRVGDPNQAIYETFTTANPKYLRAFIDDPFVQRQELPNSGRSTNSIIDLANFLVKWTHTEHPNQVVREALQFPPLIKPTALDDPQPNPSDELSKIHLSLRRYTPQAETLAVVDSVEKWLPDHSDMTVAILAPRNVRAFDVVDELKRRNIPYHDGFLRSSSSTRFSAGALGNILQYLSNPQSASRLSSAYRVWRRTDRMQGDSNDQLEITAEYLRRCTQIEDFLYPQPGKDWLEQLTEVDPLVLDHLSEFRKIIRRWQAAIALPIDQLIHTIAQDLIVDPVELAVCYKLALILRRALDEHPSWRLPELTNELAVIARNERRFLGFSDDDMGFNPERHRGVVVVSTLHKAKGLEWDRVYLISVNNYDFPSAMPGDQFISEKWFIRDNLNLEAETLAQLSTAISADIFEWYEEGSATEQARLDYVRERLRLLYVGITRAKRELIITWNTGRNGSLYPAHPLRILAEYWTGKKDDNP